MRATFFRPLPNNNTTGSTRDRPPTQKPEPRGRQLTRNTNLQRAHHQRTQHTAKKPTLTTEENLSTNKTDTTDHTQTRPNRHHQQSPNAHNSPSYTQQSQDATDPQNPRQQHEANRHPTSLNYYS